MKTRAELAATARADGKSWSDLCEQVGADRMDEPGPMGEWTFGDMSGHLLGWRNRTIARIEAAGRGEPEPADPWPADLDDDDRINDWIKSRHAGRSGPQLAAEFGASYERLASAIEGLTD